MNKTEQEGKDTLREFVNMGMINYDTKDTDRVKQDTDFTNIASNV